MKSGRLVGWIIEAMQLELRFFCRVEGGLR